jgi:hypothetical protein
MKWIKERDLLIAQTKAFVQSVTGRRPENEIRPISVEPIPAENSAMAARPSSAELSASIEPVERTGVSLPAGVSLPEIPTILALPEGDVRNEIRSRVAAFQAHQHRFHREREAYFKSVLTKARAEIENGPQTPSA